MNRHWISSLSLTNFRSYDHLKLEFDSSPVVLHRLPNMLFVTQSGNPGDLCQAATEFGIKLDFAAAARILATADAPKATASEL